MTTGTALFMLACLALVALLAVLRRTLARRGSGRLAQLEFRRRNEQALRTTLGADPDPRPGSPWVAIRVGGRAARMVAAPIGGDTLQAGIELLEHDLAVQVFHTSGDAGELELPAGTDEARVRALVEQLRALGVDNVAAPGEGTPHIMRIRFEELDALARALEAVAPLLEQLEAVAPQAPKD